MTPIEALYRMLSRGNEKVYRDPNDDIVYANSSDGRCRADFIFNTTEDEICHGINIAVAAGFQLCSGAKFPERSSEVSWLVLPEHMQSLKEKPQSAKKKSFKKSPRVAVFETLFDLEVWKVGVIDLGLNSRGEPKQIVSVENRHLEDSHPVLYFLFDGKSPINLQVSGLMPVPEPQPLPSWVIGICDRSCIKKTRRD